jgi:hypothetical protein
MRQGVAGALIKQEASISRPRNAGRRSRPRRPCRSRAGRRRAARRHPAPPCASTRRAAMPRSPCPSTCSPSSTVTRRRRICGAWPSTCAPRSGSTFMPVLQPPCDACFASPTANRLKSRCAAGTNRREARRFILSGQRRPGSGRDLMPSERPRGSCGARFLAAQGRWQALRARETTPDRRAGSVPSRSVHSRSVLGVMSTGPNHLAAPLGGTPEWFSGPAKAQEAAPGSVRTPKPTGRGGSGWFQPSEADLDRRSRAGGDVGSDSPGARRMVWAAQTIRRFGSRWARRVGRVKPSPGRQSSSPRVG